jgi:hypothetical protein
VCNKELQNHHALAVWRSHTLPLWFCVELDASESLASPGGCAVARGWPRSQCLFYEA